MIFIFAKPSLPGAIAYQNQVAKTRKRKVRWEKKNEKEKLPPSTYLYIFIYIYISYTLGVRELRLTNYI